ncbi:MAG: AmmeMemoRadiSam system protein A [Candidatus Schekmanbacteria bacterium]|nr:AmmeMemoRadiSam system protein A [Candidatus Schekmanbacteria bacterium]
MDTSLPPPAREELLHLARQALENSVDNASPAAELAPMFELSAPRGLFVTLRIDGRLRGCIGHLIPRQPLYAEVQQVALAAAMRDPRFPPMTPGEIRCATIEVSVLTPPRAVLSPNDVVVGQHGVIISRGARRAVMLPQVPLEHGWDRETFLSQTCRKAGLPADAWRQGAEIEVFEADVIAEGRLQQPAPP